MRTRRFNVTVLLLLIIATFLYTWIYLVETIPVSNFSLGTTYRQKHKQEAFWNQDMPDNSKKYSGLGLRIHHQKLDSIRIIGERHSGTSFLTRYLQDCFPTTSVGDYFVNHKHWFQPTPSYVMHTAKRYGESGLSPTLLPPRNFKAKSWWQIAQSQEPINAFNTTMLIALFRSPYQWIEGMRQSPHHWPNHVVLLPKSESSLALLGDTKQKENGLKRKGRRLQTPHLKNKRLMRRRLKRSIIQKSFVTPSILNWQDFVSRPLYLADYDERDKGVLCQFGFSFGTVSPCDENHDYVPKTIRHIPRSFLRYLPFEADQVVYELNMNGTAFEDTMQFRAAKIKNFLSIEQEWNLGGFAGIRYEDVLGADNATAGAMLLSKIIQEIASALNVKSTCRPLKIINKERHEISKEFRLWINNHVDWKTESILAYSPDDT